MGGHAGGEVASQICAEVIMEKLKAFFKDYTGGHPDPSIAHFFDDSINQSSRAIYEKALNNPQLHGMGTTATCAVIKSGFLYYGHVGDSRLYLYRGGFLYQITDDHSLVAEQVRAGLITEKEAELHQLRNVITRTVGYQEEEEVDTGHLKLQSKDKFLLCSDGLHGKLTDQEIANVLGQNCGVESVNSLITQANIKGGDDNITTLIIEVS